MWFLENWKWHAYVVFLACMNIPLDSAHLELQAPSAPGSPFSSRRTSLDGTFPWIVLLTFSLSLHMLRISLFVFFLEFFLLASQGMFILQNKPGHITPCFCTGAELCLSPHIHLLASSVLLRVSTAPPTGPGAIPTPCRSEVQLLSLVPSRNGIFLPFFPISSFYLLFCFTAL